MLFFKRKSKDRGDPDVVAKELTVKLKKINAEFARDLANSQKKFNDVYRKLRKLIDRKKLRAVEKSLKEIKSS